MNATELLAPPTAADGADAVPPDLADRARAYEAAVDGFHRAVMGVLASLDGVVPVSGEAAATLRTSARELVTACDQLLGASRLPLAGLAARP